MSDKLAKKKKIDFEILILIIISFSCMIGSSFIHNILFDKMIVLLFIHLLTMIFMISLLKLEKIFGLNSYNNCRKHGRFIFVYLMASVTMLLSNWIPGFWEPMLAFTILMIIGSSPSMGFMAGLYLVMIQSVLFEYTTIGMCKLIFCVICGGVLAQFSRRQVDIMPVAILVFLFHPCIGLIFGYLEKYQVDFKLFLTGLIYGCMNVAIFILPYPWIHKSDQEYYATTLEFLVDPRFQLLSDMKACSEELFLHGLKVSKAAGNCAERLKLNDKLVRAGGLYYRLGFFDDETNHGEFPGQMLGKEHHFPDEVLTIIQEYKGLCSLISTPEAALIDIIDEVFEQLNKEARMNLDDTPNEFNQEFLIYKIMNDCSSSGRYDHSGFTMNMYLRVRDYLVKEVDYNERFYIR